MRRRLQSLHPLHLTGDRHQPAFTLIEMLIVLFIVMLLAAVALPTVRNLLLDQKNARAARSVVSFIDVARSRAVAEGREVGIRFERLGADTIGLASSIRVRQLTGVPSYAGEANNAVAWLSHPNTSGMVRAVFDAADCQLLLVGANNRDEAPIRSGDRLELPGGKQFTIQNVSVENVSSPNTPQWAIVQFNLREPDPLGTTNTYPGTMRPLPQITGPLAVGSGAPVKFRIHRTPTPSNTARIDLPRGVAVDLGLSGIGIDGQFSTSGQHIDIIFGPDGGVSRIIDGAGQRTPIGQLFLCLGDMDGVHDLSSEFDKDTLQNDLLSTVSRSRSNIVREKMSWIVINPTTGRTFAAPSARPQDSTISQAIDAVNTPPSTPINLGGLLRESRSLAILSDEIRGN